MQAGDFPGARRFRRRGSPRCEAIDAGDALLDLLHLAECVATPEHHALPHRHTAREEPHIDEFLPGSPAGDLENRAGSRGIRRFFGRRKPLLDPGEEFGNADAGDRRSEEDRDDGARRDLRPQLRLKEGGAQITAGAIEFLDHALVRLRKEIDHRIAPGRALRDPT